MPDRSGPRARTAPLAESTVDTVTTMVELDLSAHFDNIGRTSRGRTAAGAFNIWSNTFPAEELPDPGRTVLGGVPFRFPDPRPDDRDNLRCSGQSLAVAVRRYDWLYLLAAAERRTEDSLVLHYASGAVDPEWIRVSDFWPQTPPRFGEREFLRCRSMHYPRHVERRMGPVIWRERVAVPREEPLAAVQLPDNPALHIFAATLVTVDFGRPAAQADRS